MALYLMSYNYIMIYVGGYRVTLFKCHWFDSERGIKVDGKHGLVDIDIKSKLGGNDPFVLAEQAEQVYYTTYPARKRSRTEWLGVCKAKARSTYNSSQNNVQGDEVTPTIDGFYQEDEMPPPGVVGVDVDLDQVVNLPSTEVEEVEEVEEVQIHHDKTIDESMRYLCNGPSKYVTYYNSCFVNGFKFHTKEYGEHQTTINSGVCVKGSCYNDYEKDYYVTLLNVIQLHYVGGYRVTLFKCHWFDSERGIKVDGKHGLVDIDIKSKLGGNDPFVLAEQAEQVYYTTYPARKRSRTEWLGVCKAKARSTYNSSQNNVQRDEVTSTIDGFYQEDEMPPPGVVGVDVDLDQVVNLPSTEVEEVEEVEEVQDVD
ncbi:hypothetical protein CTI12_AA313130 [Artemisia annua]|uniref:DUF4216 domain-containing protein n=1 Tax=Artemisia annua TaxID=35608 RepID=A0A2U1N3X2_ARTAN|nr:hypothetical protein CTI12_AA313130 [Artemisia annua]